MKEITVNKLKNYFESSQDVTVIDIREPDEYNDLHINGSINIPAFNDLHDGKKKNIVHRVKSIGSENPLVLVCRSGQTSAAAVQALNEAGIPAINLSGGMLAWSLIWSKAEVLSEKSSAKLIQIRRNGKGCLSYLLCSKKEGAVIDPCVDAKVYIEVANQEKVKITHVLETHVHADHLSRARLLSKKTKARMCLPRNDRTVYSYTPLEEKSTIQIGDITITAIRTPGHTLESMSYLIENEWLITGDTLFVNSVGRPDLEKGDAGAEAGADLLFKSLHSRLLTLDHSLQIFPGHHGGVIGFNRVPLSATLGDVKSQISLLKANKDLFVKSILESLSQKPPNFERIIAINEGKAAYDESESPNLEAGGNRCAVRVN